MTWPVDEIRSNFSPTATLPIALDLCCGLGGWTTGLQATGWYVIGFDIEAKPEYSGDELVIKDIRDIKIKEYITNGFLSRPVSLVVASPPCQEFSYRSFPFKKCQNLPLPDKSIWQACERIARECSAPLVLENVRGAQKFMGKAKAHYGSLYLWNDVPALLPTGKHVKGFGRDFQVQTINSFNSKSNKRKAFAAEAAKIPFELARWIGECFK